MILERVELTAKEGSEDAFADALTQRGIALLTAGAGCRAVRIARGVENPGKFILLVEWDTVAAHTAFVGSPEHSAFRQLIAPHAAGGTMEHFDLG
jgi:heme-degrading monooxygenase HmoA